MRILVHEFVSGGGLAGRDVPPSLARQGSAMLTALVADLAAIRCHQIVTTVDPRFPLAVPPGVEVVTLPPGPSRLDPQNLHQMSQVFLVKAASPRVAGQLRNRPSSGAEPLGGLRRSLARSSTALLDALIASVDAVWLVAPETDRCLERLAATVEQKGKALLGSGAAAIRHASDKAHLPRLLARHGLPHPKTRVVRTDADWRPAACEVGYPLVVKPAQGAGCSGVYLARNARELRDAVEIARRTNGKGRLLFQELVPGVAASVSLLADGQRAVALTVNAQWVRASRPGPHRDRRAAVLFRPFSYRGGSTPLDHPLAERAIEAALRTCQALPGLRGYVGVDLVLTESEAVVIEVNPRVTTAYLGVRAALDENVAALALAACAGALPTPPAARRYVRFTAAGRIIMAS